MIRWHRRLTADDRGGFYIRRGWLWNRRWVRVSEREFFDAYLTPGP